MKNSSTIAMVVFALFLTACGGGGGSDQPTSQIQNTKSAPTSSLYFPAKTGSQITYDIYHITGTLNAQTFAIENVQITSYDAVTTVLYSQGTCSNYSDEQFSVSNWYSGTNPPAGYTSPGYFMADGYFTSDKGVGYIGEGYNAGGVVSPGEPILTVSPVIGERIDTTSTVTSGCGSSAPLYTYKTSYQTIGNVDSYGVGTDVFVTGLVEWNSGVLGSENAPTAYNYTFQRDVGIIRDIVLQNIQSDYTGTGYMYIARTN